jgi:hypothetical protein
VFLVAIVMGLCIAIPLTILQLLHVPGWLIFDAFERALRFFFR